MEITASQIEEVLARLDDDYPAGLDEAQFILEHATSDDYKDRLANELHDLNARMDRVKGAKPC